MLMVGLRDIADVMSEAKIGVLQALVAIMSTNCNATQDKVDVSMAKDNWSDYPTMCWYRDGKNPRPCNVDV